MSGQKRMASFIAGKTLGNSENFANFLPDF